MDGTTKAPPQCPHPARIEFDGRQVMTAANQLSGDGAVSGTELDDRSSLVSKTVRDLSGDPAVTEEVLAQRAPIATAFVAPCLVWWTSCHGGDPSHRQ
jgi:hypothetical protein